MLIASKAKGVLAIGKEEVFKKIKFSKMGTTFVSKDISPKILMNLKRMSEEFYILPFSMNELGEFLSRKPFGVLFVSEPLLMDSIRLRLMHERAMSNG